MGNSLSLKDNKTMLLILAVLIGMAFFLLPIDALARDYAAGAKQDVQDTFGPGSTAWWVVMVLEVFASAFMYIKTKNLAVFAGIVALMLFGNVAFGLF